MKPTTPTTQSFVAAMYREVTVAVLMVLNMVVWFTLASRAVGS